MIILTCPSRLLIDHDDESQGRLSVVVKDEAFAPSTTMCRMCPSVGSLSKSLVIYLIITRCKSAVIQYVYEREDSPDLLGKPRDRSTNQSSQ